MALTYNDGGMGNDGVYVYRLDMDGMKMSVYLSESSYLEFYPKPAHPDLLGETIRISIATPDAVNLVVRAGGIADLPNYPHRLFFRHLAEHKDGDGQKICWRSNPLKPETLEICVVTHKNNEYVEFRSEPDGQTYRLYDHHVDGPPCLFLYRGQ